MARGLGTELARRGRPATFLAARHPGLPPGTEGLDEVLAWPGPFRSVRSWWFGWRVVGRVRPQAIVAHFGAATLLLVVGWLRRVPVRIVWYHTLAAGIDLDTGRLSWWRRQARTRKAWSYRLATTVVAIGEAGRQELLDTFGVPAAKVVVQPNLVPDVAAGLAPAEPVAVPTFACVARLFPVKDHATVLDAVSRTRAPVRLVLLGEGPLRAELEQRAEALGIADRVTFTGVVTHHAVLEQVQGCTATILASIVENFGIAVVESMALSVPVVATDTCEFPSIIGRGPEAGGLLFATGDADALAAHLDRLAADPAVRDQLAANARRRFVERFDLVGQLPEVADWVEARMEAAGQR
ncbi:glycosyltransferase family 4 protein [Aquihabitans sp. G128]|uniref:glycosyltransferase family 4 protein n=1 Tax=Aquihabitans sp. G128 TaxID=2849779 RepID=UPI001C2116E4|nr:glycosyltransferase family 4 protein [Aquihabitans sp. G128]QXC61562.1 glycosyltransferase family 4 protein [Aquihabitans sp. G128]